MTASKPLAFFETSHDAVHFSGRAWVRDRRREHYADGTRGEWVTTRDDFPELERFLEGFDAHRATLATNGDN